MGKWRARTSRGKRNKNTVRAAADREATIAINRPAAELQAKDEIQERLDKAAAESAARRARPPSVPPSPRAQSQVKANQIAATVAARQTVIRQLYELGHPGSSSSSSSSAAPPPLLHPPGLPYSCISKTPAPKLIGHLCLRSKQQANLAKAKRLLPKPKGSVVSGVPTVATSDPYETDKHFQ